MTHFSQYDNHRQRERTQRYALQPSSNEQKKPNIINLYIHNNNNSYTVIVRLQ